MRRLHAVALVGAVGVACGARTELGGVWSSDVPDDAGDADATASDGSDDTCTSFTCVDARLVDVLVDVKDDFGDACRPVGSKCTTSSECCDDDCFLSTCGAQPLYGAPPPPDATR